MSGSSGIASGNSGARATAGELSSSDLRLSCCEDGDNLPHTSAVEPDPEPKVSWEVGTELKETGIGGGTTCA